MNVLILIPPKVDGQWVAREDKHIGASPKVIIPRTSQTLAALLEQELPDVRITALDAQLEDMDDEAVRTYCDETSPDLIITYLSALHIPNDRHCAELDHPTLGIILHQNVDHLEAAELYDLRTPYLCKNEIEFSVCHAVREFRDTGRIRMTPGFLVREKNGWRDTGTPAWEDMDNLPLPHSKHFDPQRYIAKREKIPGISHPRAFNLNTSRGCLFNCLFCCQSNQGRPVRMQSPQKVFETIAFYKKRYGIDFFAFVDNEFAINMKRAKSICRLLAQAELGISFCVQNRVELFDDELLELLRDAGCIDVRLGIETCDPKTQKYINKECNLKQTEALCERIRALGMTVHIYMTPGIPGENVKTLWKNAGFLARVDPDTYSSGPLFLMPGSLFYKRLKEKNQLQDTDWSNYLNHKAFPQGPYRNRRDMLFAKKVMHLFYVVRRLGYRITSRRINRKDWVDAGKFLRYFLLRVLLKGER